MKDMEIPDQPTVLIVDDSPEDRQTYRDFMQSKCRVLEAGNGQAGLDTYRRAKPDCILLDYRLPDLDGLEFLEALHQDPSSEQPAVVVLTGYADVPLAVAALQSGATDFIEKDRATASSLAQAVSNAIGKVRLSRDLNQHRQWLEATFASVADGLVAVDAAGRVTLGNGEFADLSGWPLAELIGQPIAQVLTLEHQHAGQDWRQMLSRVLSGEPCASTPRWLAWMTASSGRRFPVACKLTPMHGPRDSNVGAVLTLTDLSDLDESRSALAESEQWLRLAVEVSGIGCFDWDVVAGTVSWNPQHELLWGFQPGESTGTYEDFASRVHPDDLPVVEAALARSRAERKHYRCEYRVVWPDGSERWVIGRGEFAYGDDGEPVRMRGTVFEVTERKQAEAALHASQELLARIVDSAPSAVFAMDRAHRFTLTNQANLSVCRLRRDELMGHTELEVFPSATAERLWADNEQVMITGQALQLEEELVLADGSHIDAITTKFPLRDAGGAIVGLGGVGTDISERKRAQQALLAAEERLRLALDAARMGTFDWDLVSQKIVWSPQHEALWGFSPGEFAGTYEHFASRLHPDDLSQVDAAVARSIADKTSFSCDFRVVWPDGRVIWIGALGQFIFADDGQATRMHGTVMEITERKESEAALRAAEAWRLASRYTRTLLETSLDPLVAISPDGAISDVNAAMEAATGRSRWELIGTAFASYFSAPELARAGYQEAFEAGTVRDYSLEILHRDGGLTPVLCNAAVFRDDMGKVTGLFAAARDVTRQKEAEEAIRELYNRLDRIASRVPGMIYQYKLRADGSSCFPYASEAIRSIYRVAPDAVREDAAAVLETLHPDDRDAVIASIHGSAQTLRPLQHEYRVRFDDGTVRWLHGSSVPNRGTDGAVLWHGFIHDITDRKHIELALAESNQLLQCIINTVPVRVFWKGSDLRYVGCNPAFARDAGFSRPEDLIGKDDHQLAWRLQADRYQADDRAVIASGTPKLGYEEPLTQPDGQRIWLRTSKVPLRNSSDEVIGMLGVYEDITERKRADAELRESERKFRQQSRRLTEVIWATNIGTWEWCVPTGEVLFNERWAEIVGYTLAELAPISIDTWKALVHPDDLKRSSQSLERCFRRDAETYECEVRMRHKKGDWVWIMDRGRVVEWDADDQPVRMSGTHQDIREQKYAESQLMDAMQTAEAANRAKSEFLANISHEIRTPMNTVLGLVQLLEQDTLNADQHGMVKRIRTAGQSLLGLINDILDLSKIEAGRLQIDRQPFDLNAVLSHVGGMLRHTAHGKGLKLVIEPLPRLAGCLVGDALRLEQVLLNLTGNALKFTERGEVRVRVAAGAPNAGAVHLRFEIRDTGIGIASEHVANLFSPFTQADGSITRRFGGTGLGLAICKHLIELMGGTLGVDSVLGTGSTFWFELEFELAPLDALSSKAVVPPGPGGNRLNGLHCLVVDDSEMNRDVLERLLRREGAHVSLATHGGEALEYLRAGHQPVDAVLIDLQMPVVDGFTAMSAIRGELGLSGLPLIAISAGAGAEKRQDALNAGANELLLKPVNLEAVVATVLRWTRPVAPVHTAPAVAPAAAAGAGVDTVFPLIEGLDTRQAALLLDYDRPFFVRLLRGFAADYGATAQLIQDELAADRLGAAAAHLHKLRGAAAYIGARELIEAAQRLEDAIADGDTGLGPLFETFRERSEALQVALAPWLREPAEPESDAPLLDPERLEALRLALVNRDLAALSLFDAQREALAQTLGVQAVVALDEAVRTLRFDDALAILERD
ncbi:PAS domain S-box protein [Methylolobus aquaticus]